VTATIPQHTPLYAVMKDGSWGLVVAWSAGTDDLLPYVGAWSETQSAFGRPVIVTSAFLVTPDWDQVRSLAKKRRSVTT
jgi:hypothetical protein